LAPARGEFFADRPVLPDATETAFVESEGAPGTAASVSGGPANEPAEITARRPSGAVRARQRLLRLREFGPAIGLVAVVGVFWLMAGSKVWSPQTLKAVSDISSLFAIVAIGITVLMISGEFDLSVGQNFAFTPIVWATLFVVNGWNEWLALVVALLAAASIGVVNGLVTTLFRIPSFIATLGMFFVLQGLNNLLISGHQLGAFEDHPSMTALGAKISGTPFSMPLVWMAVVAAVAWFAMGRLRFGNWTFATGGKVGPAKAMGVPTDRVKRINFIAASTLAGLAGCMQFAELRSVTQAQGDKYELFAITAAVIGGTSLFGGSGTIIGSVIGAFLLASIQIGLVLVGAPGSFYVTFIGLMLVLVVISNVRLGRFGGQSA
jgi:simple sugar transport system permease protein